MQSSLATSAAYRSTLTPEPLFFIKKANVKSFQSPNAVAHGNRVYILPNPRGIRTADFIFENKGIFKMYDLKTISGKASLENRLMESIGQTNHVLINVCSQYNPRLMAIQIRNYFQVNPTAIEVLVYKGKKMLVVTRRMAQNPLFLIQFQRKYVK